MGMIHFYLVAMVNSIALNRVYKYLSKSLLSFFLNIYIYLAVPILAVACDLVPDQAQTQAPCITSAEP